MRWPWVSRELLDGAYSHAHFILAERDVLLTRLQDADRRYDGLLEKYHALKLAGATEQVARTPVEKKSDPLMTIVTNLAGTDAPLRKHLGSYIRRQRAEGVDDNDILHALQHWPEYDATEAESMRA